MARLPPSRHALHRRLRLPDLRTGDHSPLRTSFRRAARRNLPFPTVTDPEAPPIRTRTPHLQTRSPPCATALVLRLARCPCCSRTMTPTRRLTETRDAVKIQFFGLRFYASLDWLGLFWLSDRQWSRVACRSGCGDRSGPTHRRIISGIIHMLQSGARGRDSPD